MEAVINAATSDVTKILDELDDDHFLILTDFIYKHLSARFIFASLILSMPVAI